MSVGSPTYRVLSAAEVLAQGNRESLVSGHQALVAGDHGAHSWEFGRVSDRVTLELHPGGERIDLPVNMVNTGTSYHLPLVLLTLLQVCTNKSLETKITTNKHVSK